MTDSTVIKVDNISKRFIIRKEKSLKERVVNFGRSNRFKEDFWALRDVDLEIHSGSTVGLIGANGSGKSTLLKMIGGILQPTVGSVYLRGRIAALLELGAGFHPDLTGRENVFLNASILGLSRQQIEQNFDAIVDFSGIEPFIDTQVKFFSSGMYVRLAFAVAVHVDPDILLVDEVLAVGDEPFQRKCLERIRRFQHEGRTIIIVTHSLDQVAQFCDRAVVLDHGSVIADGLPRDALRTLRADFEAIRQDEFERTLATSDGSSRNRARIRGVSTHRSTGEADDQLAQGDGMTLAVTVDAEEPLKGSWSITVGIATPLGIVLYSTSTTRLGVALPPLSGVGRFEFTLTDLPLTEGEYTVQAAIRSEDGAEIDSLPIAAQFTVSGPGGAGAPLYVPTTFAIR